MTPTDYTTAFAAICADIGLPRIGSWARWGLPSTAYIELRIRGVPIDRYGGTNVARLIVSGELDMRVDGPVLTALGERMAALPEHFGAWGVTTRDTAPLPAVAPEPHGYGTGARDDTRGT